MRQKIFFLTDTHLDSKRDLTIQEEVIMAGIDAAEKIGFTISILGGDMTGLTVPHTSSREELGVLFKIVSRLAESGPVIIVYGNHDATGGLEILEHIEGEIRVVSEYERIDVNGIQVHAIAWPSKKWLLESTRGMRSEKSSELALSKVVDILEQVKSDISHFDGHSILVSHMTIAGARLDSGEVLRGHDLTIPVEVIDEIGANLSLFGHSHSYQKMGAGHTYYGGTTFPITFGEKSDKFFLLFELGDEIIEHKIPSIAPKKITLEYKYGRDSNEQEKWLVRPTLSNDLISGNIIKFRVTVPRILRVSCPIDDELSLIESFNPIRVISEIIVKQETRVRSKEMAQTKTVEEKVEVFLKLNRKDKTTVIRTMNALEELTGYTDDEILAKTITMSVK